MRKLVEEIAEPTMNMKQNTEILELEITQEDIDRSIERSKNGLPSRCCVVSTAAQRQLNDPTIASAAGELYIYEPEYTVFDGGQELQNVMDMFDRDEFHKIKPRKFILTKID